MIFFEVFCDIPSSGMYFSSLFPFFSRHSPGLVRILFLGGRKPGYDEITEKRGR